MTIKRTCSSCGATVSSLPFVCRNELCRNYLQRVDAELQIVCETIAADSEVAGWQFTTVHWIRALGFLSIGFALVALFSVPWLVGIPASVLLAVYSIWRGAWVTVRDGLIVAYVVLLLVVAVMSRW